MNNQYIDYIIQGHNAYWDMLGSVSIKTVLIIHFYINKSKIPQLIMPIKYRINS